jgi:hypothetical protein
MSLINDALRKAQKQRTGEAPSLASMPAIGGEPAARIARRARPAGFYTLLIRLGAATALLAVVIIGGVLLLRKKAPAPAEPQPAIVAQAPAPKPADPAPVSAVTQPAASITTFVVPITAPPAPAATPKAEAPVVQTGTPKPVAAIVAPLPARPEPAKPAKLEPKAIMFIESLKVVGIRASATDSKVLMNDRVYRIGNTVEHEMGIKLTGITANSLTFEDEHGGSYTRTF